MIIRLAQHPVFLEKFARSTHVGRGPPPDLAWLRCFERYIRPSIRRSIDFSAPAKGRPSKLADGDGPHSFTVPLRQWAYAKWVAASLGYPTVSATVEALDRLLDGLYQRHPEDDAEAMVASFVWRTCMWEGAIFGDPTFFLDPEGPSVIRHRI